MPQEEPLLWRVGSPLSPLLVELQTSTTPESITPKVRSLPWSTFASLDIDESRSSVETQIVRRARSALKAIRGRSPDPDLNLIPFWLLLRLQPAAAVTKACKSFCKLKTVRLRLSVLMTWSLWGSSKL